METSALTKRKVYVHQIQSASWKNFLPLSAAMLVSYAKSIPQISKEYDFEIKVLRQYPLETVRSYKSPDVLAFSVYSWNFKQSLEVARLGKLATSDSLVVFGGPMIPTNPGYLRIFFKNYPFIDIVVHGMGEWPFSEILLAKIGEQNLNSIAGISYRKRDGSITTTEPLYNRNLDELPSPFFDGTFDEVLSRYGDRITGALWETNRGCPYTCAYCVQGNSHFSKIITFSKDRLYKELEWISKKKISYVFGTDANFGILPRDIEIAEMLAELSKRNGYPKFFIINWLKNSSKRIMEIVEMLQKGGVHTQLTLSMQSFNNDTLAAIKRKNMELSEFEDLKKESVKKGISTYTEIILGLPNDTYDSLVSTLDKCMDKYLNHFLVVYLCRMLDATEMAEPDYRNKYKLEIRSCPIGIARHEWFDVGVAETEEIIVSTSTLSIQNWEKIFTLIYTELVLYNFRLAFFIFNYLRTEYSVNLIDLIEYIIAKGDLYPTIRKTLKIINNGRQAILDSQINFISLDFTGNMLFEVHEAALLVLINEKDIFYKELWTIISDYLRLKGIAVQSSVLAEVFKYQVSRIPTWQKNNLHNVSFEFNIPQYFQALCVDSKPITIRKQKTFIEIENKDEYYNPIDFVKSRLTISKFKIYEFRN